MFITTDNDDMQLDETMEQGTWIVKSMYSIAYMYQFRNGNENTVYHNMVMQQWNNSDEIGF